MAKNGSEFSLVTINILNDLSRWRQRRGLLAEQLAELQPDLIALQEVNLKKDKSNAHWLAEELNRGKDESKTTPYEVQLCPKTGPYERKEGLAILSRLKVNRHERLDLLTQNRVAQLIEFRVDGEMVMLVNGHFFWQPGESPERQQQIELLLDWLDTQPVEIPVIVCGDFNSLPDTPSIERMRRYFDSAHNNIHGCEPEYTCPTPMSPSVKVILRSTATYLLGRRPRPNPEWRGTLDYIFVDPRLQVQNCCVVLDRPADGDSQIYPSDHFGLLATIKASL